MRFFGKCKYNGNNHNGWQIQHLNDNTIQGHIEKALSLILRDSTSIIGCGRTDSGVHASQYYFHFDAMIEDTEKLIFQLNGILPDTIIIIDMITVSSDAHARFDATLRAYEYHITGEKDPFRLDTVLFYPQLHTIGINDLNEVAKMLLRYDDFTPFCKTGSNNNSNRCTLYRSQWVSTESGFVYHVEANRFLRGMIRLIVGMTLNVVKGKLSLQHVEECLINAKRLDLDWSVPAKGLFLSKVNYPYIDD